MSPHRGNIFAPVLPRKEAERPQTMPQCDNCDAHISEGFARVFADEADRVLACPSCASNAGIADSARARTENGTSSSA